MKQHVVITIGCECGAGGPAIGRMLAKSLGIEFYDRDFIDSVVEKAGVSKDVIAKANDAKEVKGHGPGPGIFLGPQYTDLTERIIYVQFEVVRKLAEKTSCVIIGRCADYILKDRGDVLNIFVYAPDAVRVDRLMKEQGLSSKDAGEYIARRDRMLHARYKYMTGTYRGDRHNRHMLIDSSVLGLDGTAKFIEEFARRRFGLI
jgi:cytidylate kinase